MVKTYYELTKPGLVWGNLITTLAGFLFASRFSPAPALLLATLAGTALVIASACVFNNIFDREADAKMPRTKKRALVSGAISVRGAAIFGTALALFGFLFWPKHALVLASILLLDRPTFPSLKNKKAGALPTLRPVSLVPSGTRAGVL